MRPPNKWPWRRFIMPDVAARTDFDVAIIGGGPAGLSAAIVLGRARRRVAVFDGGKPRNYAAQGVHCFLGHDGIAPGDLRQLGREEAKAYGVRLVDEEVVSACPMAEADQGQTAFEVTTARRTIAVRAILVTTGVVDVLPEIPGFHEFYGRSVHHCPYCDGWEHRDERITALGLNDAPVGLAISLKTWSSRVTACANGLPLTDEDCRRLQANGVEWRAEKVTRLAGEDDKLRELHFESGPPLASDALFFSADQVQQSPLATLLGCSSTDRGLAKTERHQKTRVEGLFVAGDADGDVQFAIVAAAEGAIAAAAINKMLQRQDQAAA